MNHEEDIDSNFSSLSNSIDLEDFMSSLNRPKLQRFASRDRVLQRGSRTVYVAGRPPWYDEGGHSSTKAFLIGICGGSASGKTTVASNIIEKIGIKTWVALISMDSFYKVLSPEQHEKACQNNYNFDHPNAFDFDLMYETLSRMKDGKKVSVPIYNFQTHAREPYTKTIYGANIVIFEGIMTFCDQKLLELMDMKIFVDTDADIRLARRLRRDIAVRARDLSGVIKQYLTFVKPGYDHHIAPTMKEADVIVPRGGENTVAIHLVVKAVSTEMSKRGFKHRNILKVRSRDVNSQLENSTFHVLEKTKNVHNLLTRIRDKTTDRNEFVFYYDRLTRLLFEKVFSILPHEDTELEMPDGSKYVGKKFPKEDLTCGVAIMRAGETMIPAFRAVSNNAKLVKILIQTSAKTQEPELFYCPLPKDIALHHVILMDAMVSTGAAAIMAIRVLLDHDVPMGNIIFAGIVMSENGISNVAYAFPDVQIVVVEIEREVDEEFHLIPGMGNCGDRYFGTENISDSEDNDDY